jgi:phosphatidylglycerol:prolipoprotein diacylglycerol transferase
MLGAIMGARLFYVVSYWREEFADQPLWEVVMVHHGGLVYYGGLVGGSLATIFYVRSKGLSLWKIGDLAAPSVALGHALGRVGCLINGCCYGLPTHLPWAVCYPGGHPSLGVAVHPTQLYEAVLNLGLYALLEWRHRRKRLKGEVFALYLIGYASLRLAVEFFRGDYKTHYLGGWATPAQLISLGALVAGMALWRALARAGGRAAPAAS